ncbi:hypothetical protein ODV97_17995 [Enterococcus gallinarum]|nr:hypothetical protein [Enterococcus gallinarum]
MKNLVAKLHLTPCQQLPQRLAPSVEKLASQSDDGAKATSKNLKNKRRKIDGISNRKRGFPIKIGELEFFFGTTVEELTRFFDAQEEYEAKVKECEEKLKSIKNIDQPTKEDTLLIVELSEELATVKYDALLGEGAFKEIYEKYTDIEQLLDLFETLEFEVAEKIANESAKRQDAVSKKKADLLKKKALKNKKKK